MGQKFFDMHESSRLNMTFNCFGAFNIIYIMRTIIAEGEKQPPKFHHGFLPVHKSAVQEYHLPYFIASSGNAFEGREPKCCLLVFIDDAIGHLMHLRFGEAESVFGT